MSFAPALLAVFLASVQAAPPAPSGDPPEHCGPKRPVCLHYALTLPELAFLNATREVTSPEFLADFQAYSALAPEEKDAMVARWRTRIKSEAARRLSPAHPGRAKLGDAYFSGRLAAARRRGLLSAAELKQALTRPGRAGEAKALAARVSAVDQYAGSLAVDDVTFLSLASDASQQTDTLGRWIEECLAPAGSLVKAARGRLPACRAALGGLPPLD